MDPITLHLTIFPESAFPIARQFWQHTGMGISSRVAERCLALLGEVEDPSPTLTAPASVPAVPSRVLGKTANRHYGSAKDRYANPKLAPSLSRTSGSAAASGTLAQLEGAPAEVDTYLEERYGRNMPRAAAPAAKRAMRRRIAGVLVHDSATLSAGTSDATLGPSSRAKDVAEDDVFLYPTGMTAIWNAHRLARATRPLAKSVCFGYASQSRLELAILIDAPGSRIRIRSRSFRNGAPAATSSDTARMRRLPSWRRS
jgi:cystathionine gamma-synthase